MTEDTPPRWRCMTTGSSPTFREPRFAIIWCHWDDIPRRAEHRRGAPARHALDREANDTLPGVFGDGDWGNKDLLPDSTLADLMSTSP